MNFRPVIAATTLIGTVALLASPALAQVRQKALPDAAPARSSLLPQLPGKTATPRPTTSEEAPTPAAPAMSLTAPPSPAPPRAAITK